MPRVIDFDAFRAEVVREPVLLKIGGEIYTLSASLPAHIALEAMRVKRLVDQVLARTDLTPQEKAKLADEALGGDGNSETIVADIARSVFGDEMFDLLLQKHRLTIDELPKLVAQAFAAYNQSAEDSQADQTGEASPNRAARRAKGSKRS